jgi:DNA-binding transcriptional regulator GbsR (MarR family)
MAGFAITLKKEQVQLIEEYAVVLEKMGLQPAPSKILALLVVSDDTELTFDQIRDTLGISKSATSQAISMLLNAKKLHYKTRLGDRKRYFSTRVMSWQEEVLESLNNLSGLRDLYKKILAQRTAKTVTFNKHLKDQAAFMDFMSKQGPALLKAFEAQVK